MGLMDQHLHGITLNQVRYFARTAELGSMTNTATEMYVAQSAVSSGVAQLEAALGCSLFVRQRARGVLLTEHGRRFYPEALKILGAVDGAMSALAPGHLAGTLTVGCFTTLAPFWLPTVYENLLALHPELDVTIRVVSGDDVAPVLGRRDVEAILTYGFDYGRDVDFEQLTEAPIYAAVSRGHHLAERESVTLEDLVVEPLILLDLGKSANYFLSVFYNAHLKPWVHQRFDNFEVVRAMVARGHGYSLLNQGPAHDLSTEGQGIVRLPITGVRSHLQIGVATRSGEILSSRGQVFVDECRRIFTSSQE